MKQILSLFLMFAIPLIHPDLNATDLNTKLAEMGYIDVKSLDPDIVVWLMYASDNNFVGKSMYTSLTRAYLHPHAADALKKAQSALHRLHPGYNLKVYDAARPMSVQRIMYRAVQGTPKARYVSNPAKGGGLHNYGLAVDITIVDAAGTELDMGTPVDHLGKEANIDQEAQLVADGKISETARQNRLLLRKVMAHGGFKPLKSEWWHFNFCSRATARARYRRLDF